MLNEKCRQIVFPSVLVAYLRNEVERPQIQVQQDASDNQGREKKRKENKEDKATAKQSSPTKSPSNSASKPNDSKAEGKEKHIRYFHPFQIEIKINIHDFEIQSVSALDWQWTKKALESLFKQCEYHSAFHVHESKRLYRYLCVHSTANVKIGWHCVQPCSTEFTPNLWYSTCEVLDQNNQLLEDLSQFSEGLTALPDSCKDEEEALQWRKKRERETNGFILQKNTPQHTAYINPYGSVLKTNKRNRDAFTAKTEDTSLMAAAWQRGKEIFWNRNLFGVSEIKPNNETAETGCGQFA